MDLKSRKELDLARESFAFSRSAEGWRPKRQAGGEHVRELTMQSLTKSLSIGLTEAIVRFARSGLISRHTGEGNREDYPYVGKHLLDSSRFNELQSNKPRKG